MVDPRIRTDFSYVIILSLIVTIVSVILNNYFDYAARQRFEIVKIWLLENKLEIYTELFKENDLMTIGNIAHMSSKDITHIVKQASQPPNTFSIETRTMELAKHVNNLSKKLRFEYWILNNMLDGYENVFYEHSVKSLEDVVQNMKLLTNDPRLKFAYHVLALVERDKDSLMDYPVNHTSSLKSLLFYIWRWIVMIAKLVIFTSLFVGIMFVLFIGLIVSSIFRRFPPSWSAFFSSFCSRVHRINNTNVANFNFQTPPPPHVPDETGLFSRLFTHLWVDFQRPITAISQIRDENASSGWFSRLLGNYFDPKKSILSWEVADEDAIVGNEAVLTVKFFRNNGSIYKTVILESLRVEVMVAQNMVDNTLVYETEENAVSIHFTPIKSGHYIISVLANGELVSKSPHSRYFKAGCVDPFKSSLVIPSSLLVFEKGVQELLTFDERDKYGNKCELVFEELHKYQIIISKCKSGDRITPEITFNCYEDEDSRNKAYITITEAGIYNADILYDDEVISDNVIFMVLSSNEMAETNKNTATTNWNLWYEAYIINHHEQIPLESDSSPQAINPVEYKKKKVFCYISPKFLIVKEYWLKIFPKKLYTFRINPTVKISLLNDEIKTGFQSFTIESASGRSVKLFCQKRNILVATFVKLLLKNIGGSECFEDKKRYFYNEVKKLHSLKANMKTTVKVRRQNVVDDTWHAVKSFSPGDWWKKFEIVFEGEPGLDYGGLSREWIQKLVNELFHEALFRRFDVDNLQGLTHPNHFRAGKYKKLKYYELAGLIVGKCVIECSCDKSRQQYVKARFTRSFLSQILGLGISWKHFETDDKEYFTGKIKYIIENDPDCLDIYFTEDVYDNENQLVKTVELKSNGAKILVDESNKFDYIQRLAEYRLAESVKDEVGAFLKGLQSLIPDGLLTIFDENELELLLCGMDAISLSDLKANHIRDYNIFFKQNIVWFWTVISSFSQEELSRLLQFTTGCSQLPPEGFAGLKPKFKITLSGVLDSLPMAHTCFNQLCLPPYSSMKELKSKLVLAITEGAEGFGFS